MADTAPQFDTPGTSAALAVFAEEREQILARRARVLPQASRDAYFERGFTVAPGLIGEDRLGRLRDVTGRLLEASRRETVSGALYDLEPGHTAANPRVRRLINPVEHDIAYWEFATDPLVLDVVEDLLGPDIRFHHGKLNFKLAGGSEAVHWHQDIQFWPHTNYSPLTIGVYLEDVGDDMGAMGLVPGSHLGPLFDLYDDQRWVGHIADRDLAPAGVPDAVFPTGPAGTLIALNCRTVHGSAENHSASDRPLLLQTYAPADAVAYTDLVRRAPRSETLVRGNAARWIRHDPRPCLLPPAVIGSIFQAQQRELP